MAFNPALHSLTSKGMGMSQATPTDARSYYFDTTNFVYRPYQSTAEVLAYLNLSKYRFGNFPIYVNNGGTLNGDGTFTGGTIDEYSFKDGTTNGDLVIKSTGGTVTHTALERIFDIRDYRIVLNDSSEEANNTAKFDTMMADIVSAKGGTIIFPEVGIVYGSIVVPQVAHGANKWYQLSIVGSIQPNLLIGTVPGAFVKQNDSTSILRTTHATRPALSTVGGANSSAWLICMENMEFQSTSTADAVYLYSIAQAHGRFLLVSDGTYTAGKTSWSSNRGIVMPGVDNGGLNTMDHVAVCGFGTGIILGEHFVSEHLYAYNNNIGVYAECVHHANWIGRYEHGGNARNLVFGPSSGAQWSPIIIDQMDGEINVATINDIDNTYGTGRGNIRWSNVAPSQGFTNMTVVYNSTPKLKVAQIGELFIEQTDRGPLLQDATRLVPAENVTRYGETYGKDIWYTYKTSSNKLGETSSTAATLLSTEDGWVAMQYTSASVGAWVGFQGTTGQPIAVWFGTAGAIMVSDGTGSNVSTGVTAVEDSFYRIARTGTTWTVDSSDDNGVTWNPEYTISSPFGGSAPAGDYNPVMAVNATGSWLVAGPVRYPQYYTVASGPDTTPPTLLSATVEDATPTHVDLVFNESMSSTLPAFSAFTVSGHTVSAITRVNATHWYLTVDAFTNGETATLAYTQPGTNDAQDLAGNLLANITSAAITDNVAAADTTAPTLLSATVQNATPTRVDLVFSEAMNSTWSAFGSFTVSGHTVSAITRTGTTTGYLTVDAFVASETSTLGYTQPGSNKMQDLAGNLLANISGFSITDNVGSTFDPLTVPDIAVWLAKDTGYTTVNVGGIDHVSVWADQTPNGYDAVPDGSVTSSNYPIVSTAHDNSLEFIISSNIGAKFYIPSFDMTGTQDYVVYMVADLLNGTSTPQILIQHGNADPSTVGGVNSAIYGGAAQINSAMWESGTSDANFGATRYFTPGDTVLIRMEYFRSQGANATTTYINGVTVNDKLSTNADVSGANHINANFYFGGDQGGGNLTDMRLREVIIVAAIPSTSDNNDIETYLSVNNGI